MSEALTALQTLVASSKPLCARFVPGATDEALSHAVPEGLLAILRCADGNLAADFTVSPFRPKALLFEEGSGLRLLRCDAILGDARMWDLFAAQFLAMTPEERAQKPRFAFWRADSLPFAASDSEYVVIAAEPCFGGPAGQIVFFDFKGGAEWTIEHGTLDGWLRLTTARLAMEREVAKAKLPSPSLTRRQLENELVRTLARERGSVALPGAATADPARFDLPKRRSRA